MRGWNGAAHVSAEQNGKGKSSAGTIDKFIYVIVGRIKEMFMISMETKDALIHFLTSAHILKLQDIFKITQKIHVKTNGLNLFYSKFQTNLLFQT
jgi:hypothetical protein